jgi:uncharacterized membrane protein
VEAILFLVVSVIGLVVFIGPIFSILGFVRSRDLRRRVEELTRTVDDLERRVSTLSTRPIAPPLPPPATERPATAPAARSAPATTSAAATPPSAPTAPAAPLMPPPPVPPALARATPPPIVMPAPPAGATASTAPLPHGAAAPPPPPPPPRVRAAEAPVAPDGPPFDWESLLGIRGAAWLGGVTLVISALFFAKWGIDQGFFSPAIRVALLLLLGTGALAWAEVSLRRGFQTTANAVSGAGVVTLYVAFYAGHSLYQLFDVPVAFAGMTLVTVVGAAIAVRHEAMFTAVIGLVGGLATPVLLSTGIDRPIGFFSYLLVLAVGFLFVAERRQWPALTILAAIGTSLLELGWYASYMVPEKLVIGLAGFTAIAAAYLWHAAQMEEAREPLARDAASAAALLPLVAVVLLAADARFADRWLIVVAYLAMTCGAALWIGVRRELSTLVGAVAGVASLAIALIGSSYLGPDRSAWGLAAGVTLVASIISLLPASPLGRQAAWLDESTRLATVVRLVPAAGLFLFAWAAVDAAPSTWLFVALVAIVGAFTVAAADVEWRPGVLGAGSLLLGALCLRWFDQRAQPGAYLGHLVIPHLFAVATAIVVAWRRIAAPPAPAMAWWHREETAVLAATALAYTSLYAGVDNADYSAPAPLFTLLAVDIVLALMVALVSGRAGLVAVAAASAVVFSAGWHQHFTVDLAATAAGAYAAVYVLFLVLPFATVRRLLPAWTAHPAPWLTSALIGPAMFWLFYDIWTRLWGKGWVGVLPVALATASVAALSAIRARFAAGGDAAAERRRLNYLALFAAVALGFVATAIPIQLDRQWITIGWALEAAAVWWLFGILPHPGLKYFGLALYLAVAARLLVNPEVLRYQPRGGPLLNWLLYTYGVPALACLLGARWLRHAERRRGDAPAFDVLSGDRRYTPGVAAFLGLLLIFWLINLEIADFYSAGRYVEIDLSRHLQRDLTRSFAWGLYAIALLVVGMVRAERGLRIVALGFVMLTVGKVFVWDLGQLTGLYRILSFLALGASLIVVSLLYQRFARRDEAPAA